MPVWLVSRAVVFSILVAETCLPFGGMESYDDIRFLGIWVCGVLGCIASDCDADCDRRDVGRDVSCCVSGVGNVNEANGCAIVRYRSWEDKSVV